MRPGETLSGIAARAGVTVSQLVAVNRLPRRALVPGQALLIPARRYTVQPGDTLWSIARRSGVPLPALQQANPQAAPGLEVGQTITLPDPTPMPAEVIGYLPVIDPGVTAEDIEPRRGLLTYVAVFAHLLDAEGNLAPVDDTAAIRAAYDAGATPLLSIANMEPGGAFSPAIARAVLTSPAVQERVIAAILRLVEERGYGGVDADIENIDADLAGAYVEFLSRLKERLGRRLLNVAVSPQVEDRTFTYARGLDYPGIGRVADRVYLMNYEFHWVGGPPGPIAPLPQIRRVMQYAASVMPRQKILNGIAISGYDWPVPAAAGERARAYSAATALDRAVQRQVPIQYDEQDQAPWYRYREDDQAREVWFEDARSLMSKLLLVRDLGLGGIGIWHLGLRSPQLPALMRHLLRVQTASASAPAAT